MLIRKIFDHFMATNDIPCPLDINTGARVTNTGATENDDHGGEGEMNVLQILINQTFNYMCSKSAQLSILLLSVCFIRVTEQSPVYRCSFMYFQLSEHPSHPIIEVPLYIKLCCDIKL